MKRTQWLALFQDIKATAVSFLSIVLFVALGIAVFLGIKWNEPALTNTANDYYAKHRFHDFALTFPIGITQDDLNAVKTLDVVSDAEGAYSAYGTAWVDGSRYVLVIQSLTERIDTATVLEGRMPSASNEVGVERLFAEAAGLAVGDVLAMEAVSKDRSYLNDTDFTITAIVEHPAYIRPESQTRGLSSIGDGAVDFYVLMSPAAFNPAAYDGCFSQVLLRCAALSGLHSFDASYTAQSAEIIEQLKTLSTEHASARSAALCSRYQDEIADGESQIADAENALIDGRQGLAEGKQSLKDAEERIAQAETEIADNRQILAEAEAKYAAGKAEYEANVNKLAAAYTKLKRGLRIAGFYTDPETARKQIASALGDLYHLRDEVGGRKRLLDEVIAFLAQSRYWLDPAALDAQLMTKIINGLGEAGYKLQPWQITVLQNSFTVPPLSVDQQSNLLTILSKYDADPTSLSSTDVAALLQGMQDAHVSAIDLTRAESLLAAKLKEAEDGLAKITDGTEKMLVLRNFVDEYIDSAAMLKEAGHKLTRALNVLTEGRERFRSGEQALAEGRQTLADSRQELSEAETKLHNGEAELAANKTKLENAKSELISLASLDSWTLQTRNDNPGFATAKAVSGTTRKLCYSMALLFVFVGMMVCYTSVSRIINESQTMTGVQKALGFRNKEIVMHYMIYAILAVVLGAGIGGALGYYGIESIVNASYARNFVFDRIPSVFYIRDLLTITAVELALICLATWLPCQKLMKRQAVDLLRGDNHGGGRTRFYEKLKIWQECSLYTQTTVNNLVNDSSRVIASLVGVAGCTALIVMALSAQLALVNTPKKHFENVWRYDVRLVCDNRVAGAQDTLRAALDKEPVQYTPALQSAVFIEDREGALSKADLIVPEEAQELAAFIRLNDWKSKQSLTLSDDGVLVSRTYAKHHNLKIGDTLRLLDMKGQRRECVVAGITEHYLSTNQLVMSSDYYARVMQEPAESNTFFINCEQTDPIALENRLRQVDGYFSLINENAKWSAFFEATFKSTSLIVYICLFLSAMMALLVLLNLNVVFINEKARELIIMRINGFSIRATKRYIYRDNIVLTILGILLGIALGLVLAAWVLGNLQHTGDNFYTAPNLIACLIGAGLSGIFSLITNLIALRRVDRLKVSDIGRM